MIAAMTRLVGLFAPALGVSLALSCGGPASSSSDSESESGEDQFCGLGGTGGSAGVEGPWLELYHGGAPVEDGVTLTLVCGGQGSWMFQLDPFVGGFVPEGDFVNLAVEMNVAEHNVADGHFFKRDAYPVLVGCEEPNDGLDGGGGVPKDIIAVLPPDELLGVVHTLDGQSGDVTVTLTVDDVTIERAAQVTLSGPGPDDECFVF